MSDKELHIIDEVLIKTVELQPRVLNILNKTLEYLQNTEHYTTTYKADLIADINELGDKLHTQTQKVTIASLGYMAKLDKATINKAFDKLNLIRDRAKEPK